MPALVERDSDYKENCFDQKCCATFCSIDDRLICMVWLVPLVMVNAGLAAHEHGTVMMGHSRCRTIRNIDGVGTGMWTVWPVWLLIFFFGNGYWA